MAVADAFTGRAISHLTTVSECEGSHVRQFLSDNPELIPALDEIAAVVPSYFGSDVRLALEVLHDPEDGQEPDFFAVIQTSLRLESALERLRAFDNEWWFARSQHIPGPLTVTLE